MNYFCNYCWWFVWILRIILRMENSQHSFSIRVISQKSIKALIFENTGKNQKWISKLMNGIEWEVSIGNFWELCVFQAIFTIVPATWYMFSAILDLFQASLNNIVVWKHHWKLKYLHFETDYMRGGRFSWSTGLVK